MNLDFSRTPFKILTFPPPEKVIMNTTHFNPLFALLKKASITEHMYGDLNSTERGTKRMKGLEKKGIFGLNSYLKK